MNTPKVPAQVDSSNTWGKTPVNPIQITQAFSNDPDDRPYQDVGFDGLDDNAEKVKKNYILQKLANNFGTSSLVYQKHSLILRAIIISGTVTIVLTRLVQVY